MHSLNEEYVPATSDNEICWDSSYRDWEISQATEGMVICYHDPAGSIYV